MTDALRARLLAVAESRRGIPYALPPDPNGVSSIDCSLYVVLTYADAGAPFPAGVRTAQQLRQASIPIDWADVRPGDLLFFEHTYAAPGPAGPDGRIASHAGISLGAGTRKMWNAVVSEVTGVSGVQVTYLSDEYWQRRLFEARRHPALVEGPPLPAAAPTGRYAYLTLWPVNLRAEPTTSASIVRLLHLGSVVRATGAVDSEADGYRWLVVDGGYVAEQLVRVMPFGGDLDPTSERVFTFAELWPAIQAACNYYGSDATVAAGILAQESSFRNYQVHLDGTGHGLAGLDDSGGWQQIASWLGIGHGVLGWSSGAVVLPPGIQIEFLAFMLGQLTASYGSVWTAARVWHRGPRFGVDPNDARAAQYEALIRGHVARLFTQ